MQQDGHGGRTSIGQLVCPIGLTAISDKAPAAIAASVVAQLLMRARRAASAVDRRTTAAAGAGRAMADAALALAPDKPAQPDEVPLLEAVGITKRYGDFVANDHIDLDIRPGEIHALLGENGAGKSTLVKMLYGVLQPDAGEIRWKGEPVDASPARRRRAQLGIGMVFQHFSLFEALTVAENIALGAADERRFARRSPSAIAERLAQPTACRSTRPRRSCDLSVGERQRIEIVRCLLQDPKLLILDEPTSVLTPQEADQLFVTLRAAARRRAARSSTSRHRLEEVQALCDTRHHPARTARWSATAIRAQETARSAGRA